MLVKRLARAIWRTERNDRLQESIAVRLVSEMTLHVDTMVANVCAQYDEKVKHLEWLLQRLADDQFATRADHLKHFVAAYGESPQGRAREILVCLNRLVDPAEFGVDAEGGPAGNLEENSDQNSAEDSEREDSSKAGGEAEPQDDAYTDDESELDATEAKTRLGGGAHRHRFEAAGGGPRARQVSAHGRDRGLAGRARPGSGGPDDDQRALFSRLGHREEQAGV